MIRKPGIAPFVTPAVLALALGSWGATPAPAQFTGEVGDFSGGIGPAPSMPDPAPYEGVTSRSMPVMPAQPEAPPAQGGNWLNRSVAWGTNALTNGVQTFSNAVTLPAALRSGNLNDGQIDMAQGALRWGQRGLLGAQQAMHQVEVVPMLRAGGFDPQAYPATYAQGGYSLATSENFRDPATHWSPLPREYQFQNGGLTRDQHASAQVGDGLFGLTLPPAGVPGDAGIVHPFRDQYYGTATQAPTLTSVLGDFAETTAMMDWGLEQARGGGANPGDQAIFKEAMGEVWQHNMNNLSEAWNANPNPMGLVRQAAVTSALTSENPFVQGVVRAETKRRVGNFFQGATQGLQDFFGGAGQATEEGLPAGQ